MAAAFFTGESDRNHKVPRMEAGSCFSISIITSATRASRRRKKKTEIYLTPKRQTPFLFGEGSFYRHHVLKIYAEAAFRESPVKTGKLSSQSSKR